MTESPSSVGRYQIVQLIAHGGMGSLYLARDPAIDRLIAIKLLKQGFDDPAARERFAREARATGRLRHPNIVTVFDAGEHDNRPFIAMEYVPGATLEQFIQRRAPLTATKKLAMLDALCAALHYAHGCGIVHRDIKPANVILDIHDTLKILDFGIARAGESGTTQAGDLVGTLSYMSPEQLVGSRVDHRADVYAVGALAYEFMSYERAFPGSVQDGALFRILHAKPVPLEIVAPGIDPALPAIVDRAMAKDPDLRYQDLESLRQDLLVVRNRLVETGAGMDSPAGEAAGTGVDSGDWLQTMASAETLLPGSPTTGQSPTGIARNPSSGRVAVGSGTLSADVRPLHRADTGATVPPIGPPAGASESQIRRRKLLFVSLGAAAIVTLLLAASLLWLKAPAPAVPGRAGATSEPPAVPAAPDSAGDTSDAPPGAGRAADEQLTSIRETARRQISDGEPSQALDTVSAGLILEPGDPELNALIDRLKRGAEETARQARLAASRRGATEGSSREFRDARAAERDADALSRAGERAPSIRARWAAAALYDRAPAITAGKSVPAPPPDSRPAPESRSEKTDPSVTPPEAPPPMTPSGLPPQSLKTLPGQPQAPVAPPAAPSRTRTASSPGESAPDPRVTDAAAINEALRRYEEAYESRDIAAVKAVLPSLSPQQLRSVERDLANYRSFSVDITDVRLDIDGSTATVTCQVSRSFVTTTGVDGRNTVPTVFHLRKIGGSWVIDRLE